MPESAAWLHHSRGLRCFQFLASCQPLNPHPTPSHPTPAVPPELAANRTAFIMTLLDPPSLEEHGGSGGNGGGSGGGDGGRCEGGGGGGAPGAAGESDRGLL